MWNFITINILIIYIIYKSRGIYSSKISNKGKKFTTYFFCVRVFFFQSKIVYKRSYKKLIRFCSCFLFFFFPFILAVMQGRGMNLLLYKLYTFKRLECKRMTFGYRPSKVLHAKYKPHGLFTTTLPRDWQKSVEIPAVYFNHKFQVCIFIHTDTYTCTYVVSSFTWKVLALMLSHIHQSVQIIIEKVSNACNYNYYFLYIQTFIYLFFLFIFFYQF